MPQDATTPTPLPLPFYDDGWNRAQQEAAHALWAWHQHLAEPQHPALDGDDLAAFFAAEHEKVVAGEPVTVVPDEVATAAYAACEAHQLPRELLARQVLGAADRQPPVRFTTGLDLKAFLDRWATPHGRLLARLAGVKLQAQMRQVDELAYAYFFVHMLVHLPEDLAADRLFIPQEDLEKTGVTLDELKAGTRSDAVEKLLWRQVVRARDAFAQGRPLVDDLSGRTRRAFKRWWLGGLEVLHEIRRRKYDVWSEPISLSARHRLQVRFQALFGRTTFR